MMEFWQKMVFPVRRLWFAVSTRVNSHTKNGGGLLKLHNDVQSCGYEDVQVMWEMLRRSEVMSSSSSTSTNHRSNKLPPPQPKNNRPFWRIFVWSSSNNNSSASSLSTHRP